MRLRKEHIQLIGWTLKEEPISVDLNMKVSARTNVKLSTYYLLHPCIFCVSFCTKSTPMRNPWAAGLDVADAAWVEKKSWHLEWKRSCCLTVESRNIYSKFASLPSGSWSCQLHVLVLQQSNICRWNVDTSRPLTLVGFHLPDFVFCGVLIRAPSWNGIENCWRWWTWVNIAVILWDQFRDYGPLGILWLKWHHGHFGGTELVLER